MSLKLVDTHCHIQSIGAASGEAHTIELWSKLVDQTQADIINQASESGVTKLIAVGCNLEDSILASNLAAKTTNIWASIGIHPHEADSHIANQPILDQFAALVTKPKVVAVGECGLDYYYNHSGKKQQKNMLELQLSLALEHDLPLIFHVREAYDDFWPIINSYNSSNQPIRAVLHSFTDKLKNLEIALKNNFYIGVNGIATFNKDRLLTEVYKSIPLNNLVLETDSPYLTPAPIRGSINKPENVKFVAEYLAELRDISPSKLARSTTANATKLFSI